MTTATLSARDRLLTAANELFYEEGVHTVGIDRIIERAGVAKATLYSTFGSKEELVRAYLRLRHDERAERWARVTAPHKTPRAKLLAIFDSLAETYSRPTFRGCAFVNASAESRPGSAAEEVSDVSRAWIKETLTELCREAGAAEPALLGMQLALLYDGATVGARMDRSDAPAHLARGLAESLLIAALPA